MKKKIIIIATLFTMLLTGCGSTNSNSTENHLNWNINEVNTQSTMTTTNITETTTTEDPFKSFYKDLSDDLFDFYVNDKKYSINKTICQQLIDDKILTGSETTAFNNSLNDVNTGIPDTVYIDQIKGKYKISIAMKTSNKPIKDNVITRLTYYIDDPNDIQLSTKVKLNFPFTIEDILYSPDIIKQHLGEPTSADTYNNITTYSYDNVKEMKSISFTYKDGTLNEILISIL